MAKPPKFSIVTSFFGEPKEFVDRLYQSILQTNVDWEWVVTEDFSGNKETEKALSEIARRDKRVKKIKQKSKREIFRNPWLYARGEFIFHIDGDDDFHPLYLQHCQEWFRKFPDVVCIVSGGIWINEKGSHTNFFIDRPFVLPGNRNGTIHPLPNYLGRIWRSSVKIDFNEIFDDQEDIISANDRFIVEYLSTKGEILHLPRTYIKYITRKDSNSHRERTEGEKKTIQKINNQFNSWLERKRKVFSRSTHFCTGEDDFEEEVTPFLNVDWTTETEKVGVFGFSNLPVKKKLLQELFPEFIFSFEPNEDEIKNLDLFVVSNLKGEFFDFSQKRIYMTIKFEKNFQNWIKEIGEKYVFMWVGNSDFFWIKKL
jgi:hypothetical protein